MTLPKFITRVFLLGLLLAIPKISLGQALSKQDVLSLHRARIDDSVIIQKIVADGINFEMSAQTILELQKSGISAAVMKALIAATTAAKVSANVDANASGPTPDIKILYQEGKYPELADRLEDDLKSRPNDVKTRTLLIMVDLKLGQKDLAMKEFDTLKAEPQTDSTKIYVGKVNELLAALASQEETKEKLNRALENYSASEADDLINQLSSSEFQKDVLRVFLRVYQGDYEEAQKIASNIPTSSHVDQEKIKAIQDQIASAQTSFTQLTDRIEVYLHSPLAPSFCYTSAWDSPDAMHTRFGEFASISLSEYLDLVEKLSKLAPLNENALDLVFHGEMISAKYEDLEIVGDRILKAKGTIKIPFYSDDRYFWVVIDQKNRKLFTTPDNHPFTVRYALQNHGLSWSYNPSPTNGFNSKLVPFDLGFGQITGVSQKAKNWRGGQGLMEKHSYALKLEPDGVAPDYALMTYLHCSAGADAQETATQNLGKFVVHVIGNPNLKTELVAPEKIHAPNNTFTMALLAFYGGMAQAQGNVQGMQLASQVTQQLVADTARQEAALNAQEATWYSIMTKQAFSFVEGNDFVDLEKLIGTI